VGELYPGWPAPPETTISVGRLGTVLEGASRPGHFDGVAAVLVRLLSRIGRSRTYLGEKDYQQLCVVRQVVRDLALAVEVVPCATSREPDGLARSSRNVRLDGPARSAAPALARALCAAQASFGRGVHGHEPSVPALEATMREVLLAVGPVLVPDYASVVHATTLEPLEDLAEPEAARLVVACVVGGVRLIDNAPLLGDAPGWA
jgi:pantoate--beta-alanine ligase